jgi:NAD(P)-dependent dehydrogenase (short-subunit alcohol dehydrogenase family)
MAAKMKTSGQRVALVTGGGSGIGLAAAERLIGDGWRIAVVDRSEQALEGARRALGAPKAWQPFACDVTDEPAVVATVRAAAARLGPITGVVNSAGIAADVPALDTTAELFRRILDVNVVGTFLVAREAAKAMKETGGGAIVNIASISGLRGSKGRSAYGASKGAVITLTQVLANDLARYRIRVNAVAPGPVETPMVGELHTPADRVTFHRFIPMRRYAVPAEIASAIRFLLDEREAAYITGEILAVDGGFRGAGVMVEE